MPEDKFDDALQGLAGFKKLIGQEHLSNFRLWHEEDRARRRDVSNEVIAQVKRNIDALNQERNDLIEQMDERILKTFLGDMGEGVLQPPYNTETPGSGIDRLSILSLKLYHMREQTKRDDVDGDHRTLCEHKYRSLLEQRDRLVSSVGELLDEVRAGRKGLYVYRQFKMYNDPKLNPELYRKAKTENEL
jgi:hypothetical protein